MSLLKDSSHRKRKRSELEEVKGEELKLQQSKQDYLLEVKRLKKDFAEMEGELSNYR